LLQIIFVKKTGEKVAIATNKTQGMSSNTTPTKSVTFGGVTKKTFMPREAITNSKHHKVTFSNSVTSTSGVRKGPGSIIMKTGVFSRLGS
jgi:hypothetical protein